MEGSSQGEKIASLAEGGRNHEHGIERRKTIQSMSGRLRRQINGVISALASLTKSGRLDRVAMSEQERGGLEDSREIVALSLDAFTDGILCVGGMAESLKEREDATEKTPYQLVVEIIEHTAKELPDHPFFREAGIGLHDTLMVEEAENAIMVHVRGSQGYQKIPCSELFTIPENMKQHLDEVVTMWSHFFGKEYDIACFYDREVFEKLEDLKERAKPLNRLFGGIIRAFDDAIDAARAGYQRSLQGFEETRTELEPNADEIVTLVEVTPVKKTHGISQPFFPPPSLDQVYEEIRPSEQRLVEMDSQFDPLVEELMGELKELLHSGNVRASEHQVVDLLPEAETPDQKCLDRIYREIVPGSPLNLLNPRTFVLALLRKWAEQKRVQGDWDPGAFRAKSIRQILLDISPGELLLQELGSLVSKGKEPFSHDQQADEIQREFGRLAELATSAVFAKTSTRENIATAEVLCHEHLIRPEKPFSFSHRIASSPVLQGEKATTEDKLCRLLIGLIEIFQGRKGAKPAGISGVFFLITGHYQEGKRWIKGASADEPLMEERCRWLQGVFEKYFQEKEIQIFGRAFFGLLQEKTKQEWDGLPKGMSIFKLVQHQAIKMSWNETEVEAFCQAYDAAFSGLEQTVAELIEGIQPEKDLAAVAWGIHAYWHKSLLALLPILSGLLRADTRLRGHLASIGSVRSLEISGLNGPRVIEYLRKAEKEGKIVLPSVGKEGINPYFLRIKRKRKSSGSP